jgi:hypothetical protein
MLQNLLPLRIEHGAAVRHVAATSPSPRLEALGALHVQV